MSSGGLPIGMQFASGFGRDGLLFQLAGQLERARPWIDRRPPVCVGTSRAATTAAGA
jgi:amidase